MVAVIAGNGLGLDNTSLRQLGQGLGGQAAIGQSGVNQYLNAATGNLVLQSADEGLIFDGLPLDVLRTYNSQGQLAGNQGWLFGFTRSIGSLTGTLNTAGSTITRTDDDGSAVSYAYSIASGQYVSTGQSGAQDTLRWSAVSSNWTWTDSTSSQQETYSATGQLSVLSDARTGASYQFSYSGGQLSQITAGDGDRLLFGYNAAHQLITLSIQEVPPGQTTAVTRQQVGYGYDAQGRLSTVTTTLASDTNSSAASYLTTYTYDGSSDRVASVTQSDGTAVSYTYAVDVNGLYRVATMTTGTGAAAQTLTLSYVASTDTTLPIGTGVQTMALSYTPGIDTTRITNALGQAWTYTYNEGGQLSAVSAPSVNGSSPITKYQYDSNGNLLQATDADGGIISYSYDASGNLLSVVDATGHTVSYTYNADDQVLSQTVYTAPALGVPGQSGYVAPGGAQTTYYVYDASDRLSYVVDPLGNVTEHDYTTTNGMTVLSSTKQYLGATYNLTGLSPSTPPTLATLQGWVASVPVQATLGRATRIGYSYDVRGQLAKQTQWDTVDGSGVGVLDAGTTITTTTYDAQGRLLQTATERGTSRTTLEATSYAYDGLGRLLSRTDPLGHVTSYLYTDNSDTLAITQANGLTTTQVRNSAGLLLSSTQSASGQANRVTTYLYNAAGQGVATIDPAGNVSYIFYDAAARVAGTIDATGAVTAIGYDADGHAISSTRYATLVSTSGWVSGGALTTNLPTSLPVPTSSASDRTSHVVVDAAGRAVATIDAEGNVATTAYDGEGNAISRTAYATALTPAQLAALGSTPTWATLQADIANSANDRITHTFYDTDNRVVANQDAAGYVTTTAYDAAGRAIKTVGYAVAVAPTSSLATLLAGLTTTASDQITRVTYDGEGRVVAQVDADGYLTTIAYDEIAHVVTTARYATALTATQLTSLTGSESVVALIGLLGSNITNQQSSVTYNAENQVASATAVDGTVTTNSYNLVGQLLITTVLPATGQGTTRTTSATYDAFGDTLTHIDGNHATTTYTYNALGQRITATDALGNRIYTYYDADGRVAYSVQGQLNGATRNALGSVTAYQYNAFGQVTNTRRYASQLILTSGTSSGTTLNPTTATLAQMAAAVAALPVSASDANGLTSYTYTLDGQLASATDGLGYQSAYTYDTFGDRLQVQQQLNAPGSALSAANSTTTLYTYGIRGLLHTQTDGVGTAAVHTTTRVTDAFGRLVSTTDGNGNVITYSYDDLGREVSTSQTVQGAARTARTTYDAFGRTVTQTDALGNVTVYQYNLAAHTTLVTTPDGVTMSTAKDAFGDTVGVTDGAGDTTTYAYDANGQLQAITDALGNTSTRQYDLDGELIQTTDATGHVVVYGYDASGRVLNRTVDPSGLALKTTYSYDGEGRQLSVTDPTGVLTTYAYDADGHVLTQVQDAGAGKLNLTTTYTHDGSGKTLTVTEGAGTSAARTTKYGYDNLERLTQQVVDPSGLHLTTSYTYDANNNLTSVTDANGHVTRSVYSEANEKLFTLDPTGAITQYWYDADGRVTQTRGYNAALTSSQLSALGATPTAAQLAALVVPTTSDAFHQTAYNAEGQAIYEVDGVGLHVTKLTYDTAGRLAATTRYATLMSATPAGTSPTVAAIAALVTASAADETTLTTYDADGQVRFTVQTNTVNGQLVGIVSEQRYDAAGRLFATQTYGTTIPLNSSQPLTSQVSTSSLTQSMAAAPNQLTRSRYDNAGRLRYVIDATSHVTETQYDKNGRVLKQLSYPNAIVVPATINEATIGAAVAAVGTVGARISTTTYDAAGRVLATGDALGTNATFAYDATGLQTGHADRDGHWTYDFYDKVGRKTLEQSPSVNVGSWAAGTGAFQQGVAYLYTAYAYDGMGNVAGISRGTGPDATHVTTLSTTSYAYDAANHQIQTTYPGNVSTHVVYNALGQAVVDQDANGHYQYKAYVSMGWEAYSVDADGYVTGTNRDAFGNVISITRYATALNKTAISGWSAGQPLTLAQVEQGLVTSASDRTITTTYDQRNQKLQVQQSAVAYALGMGPLAGTAMTAASPTTTYTYDAYGNVTSIATLLQGANVTGNGNATAAIWATTHTYYDALNRAVMTVSPAGAYTNPQGYVTATTYNGLGDVLSTTQYAVAIAAGGLTTATPPAAPAANAFDRTTTYGYDTIGRKIRQTDTGEYSYVNGTPAAATGSSTTTLTYDGENRVTSLTVNGMTTTTAYDAAGRVASVTAPASQVLVSNWQALLQSTPGDNLASAALYTTLSPVTSVIYDALGNTLVTTVQAGAFAQQTWAWYDGRGNQLRVQDTAGNQHYSTYDNNGNVTGQTATLTGNGAASTVTSSYTYDANNQQLTTIVQRNGQSGYDGYVQVQYNVFGEVVAKGDNAGLKAQYTYNNAGQLTKAPDSTSGAIHSYTYDLANHQVADTSTVTGGGATTWTQSWLDLGGRTVKQRSPSDSAASGVNAGVQSTYTNDRWDNVTTATDAAGNTTQFKYDCKNQVFQETEASVLVVSATGARTWMTPSKEWYYNVSGQLIGATDENAYWSWNTYDAAGNLTIAQDAAGAKTYTAYDALGRAVAQQTPPAATATGAVAHITYTAYDNLNQVVAQGDFLLNDTGTARTQQAQQSYVLNSYGDRIRVTDALGNTSYYGYDSQHRVLSSQTPIQHDSGWSATFTYDANGNKTDETTANGDHQSWVYDYFGRVQSHVDLSGATTTYNYDASSGLLTSQSSNWSPAGQTNPGYLPGVLTGSGGTTQYQYEADGQLSKITQLTGGTVAGWDTYQYDVNGNRTVDATYTTDGAGQVAHTETISRYDSHNRLSTVTTENPDNSVATSRLVYNYDAAGNRRAVFAQSAYGPNATPISGNGGAPTGTVGAQTALPSQAWSLSVAGNFVDNVGFGLTFAATQSNGSALPSWMTFNSNGNFSGAPTTEGSWAIKVTATDVNGQNVSSTFTVTVPVAAPVFVTGANNQIGAVGTAFTFAVPNATDANGSALSYSAGYYNGSAWVALPAWINFNASTLIFTGTPPPGGVGAFTFGVTAHAANGGQTTKTFALNVLATPPVYNNTIGNQTVFETHAFAFSFPSNSFSESDGTTLNYTAGQYQMVPQGEGFPPEEDQSALPSWMTFYPNGPNGHTFTGTPPQSALNQTFKLYLSAVNPQGQSVEAHFTVTVAAYQQPPPVYNGGLVNHTGVIGGASLNINLPANAFSESGGDALTYTGMVLIPAHELDYPVNGGTDVGTRTVAAQWVALSQVGLSVNATTGAITGVPTPLSYVTSTYGAGSTQHDTSYQIEIIATNAMGGTAAGSFNLTNTFAPPLLITPLVNLSVSPGQGWVAVVQSNTFGDPAGHGLTYSATLSNGAALPSGLSWSGTYLSVGAVAAGSYVIKVNATDYGTASATFTLTVANVAPVFTAGVVNQTAVQGGAFSYAISGATDANGDSLVYSVGYLVNGSWVALPSWISFNPATRTYSGTPPTVGTFTFACWANDYKGGIVGESFVVTVNPPANQPPVYHNTIYGIDFNAGTTNRWTVPAGAFTNPAGRALTYALVRQNGLAFPAGYSFSATTGTLSTTALASSKVDRDLGNVVLTATDAVDGLSASAVFDLSVTANLASTNVVGTTPMTAMTSSSRGTATPAMLTAQTVASAPNIQSYWFTYDADNRVLVSNGALTNGQIGITAGGYGAPSVGNQYDAAGNVVLRNTLEGDVMSQRLVYDARNELVETDYKVNLTLHGSSLGAQSTVTYDSAGHQRLTETYFRGDARASTYGTGDFPNGTEYMAIGGWLSSAQLTSYSADGTVTSQASYGRDGDWQRAVIMAVNYRGQTLPNEFIMGVDGSGPLNVDATTTYTSYDHADNVLTYNYYQASQSYPSYRAGYGANYTVSYLKKDGYLERSTAGTATVSGYIPATDTSDYDAFGRRLAVAQASQSGSGTAQTTTRVFAFDAAGEIVQRRSGTVSGSAFTPYGAASVDHYTYANGQQLSMLDEGGGIQVLDTLTGFSSGDSIQGYVVQSGDTLASIAQAVYGNSNYGYIVADANGLTDDSGLVVGQNITLPSVTTSSNSANTFKPYNPNEVIGSTTPSLPAAPPPPPSQAGCSTLAMIVIVAVIVVASIFTAGLAAEAAAGTLGSVGAGATFSAGLGVVSGGTLGAAIGTGATIGLTSGSVAVAGAAFAGGFAGSLAGQVAGNALGVEHGYSLQQALAGGLTSALTAGIGGQLGEGGSVLVNSSGHLEPLGAAAYGAGAYASGVAANKVTGQPVHFSWAGVAASAIAAGVTAEAGLPGGALQKVGQTSGFAADVAGGLLSGGINRETSQLLGDNHVARWGSIGEDVFGNALGNAAIGAVNEAEWKAAQPAIEKQAGSFIDDVIGADGVTSATAGSFYGMPPSWQGSNPYGNLGSTGELLSGSNPAGANGSAYSLVPGDKVGYGYPVPADYTTDPGIINPLYAHTVAYVNSENQQPLTYLPPVPGPDDPRGLIDYNHQLQKGLYPSSMSPTAMSGIQVEATTNASIMGITDAQVDADIAAGRTSGWDAASYAARSTLYEAWNFASVGFVKRNDARLTAEANGRLSHDNYWTATAFDAVGSVASLLVAGRVGGYVAGRLGSGYVGYIGSGAAGAGGFDLTQQATSLSMNAATHGETGQSAFSWGELTATTAGGAITGGLLRGGDSLNTAWVNRTAVADLANQEFVYRGTSKATVAIYEAAGHISGAEGEPTYFSLEAGATPFDQANGAQMFENPEILLRIPVSEIQGASVPRPYGGEGWIGREYVISSYPENGTGGYRQFVGTTKTFSNDWIVQGWGNP